MRFSQIGTVLLSGVLCLALIGCGFKLRETTELPPGLQKIGLSGLSIERNFGRILRDSFTDARSHLTANSKLPTQLVISNLEEDRRVASYAADLSVRQYLLFILFDYSIVVDGKTLFTQRVKLDKTMIYDADFVLGKQEEERQIRKSLREDAARLILLRVKSLSL